MEKNAQNRGQTNPRLDTPSEANREKHINFREVAEESSGQIIGNRITDKERQELWQQGLKEGQEEDQKPGQGRSAMPLDNDETIGNP